MPSDVEPGGESRRKVGPGNKLPKAKKAEIAGALGAGASIKEAAVMCEVSPSTITALLRDEEFRDMLQTVEDIAVNTILQEVVTTVRRGVLELGPKALDVVGKSLESEDGRTALQAAGMVLRGGGMMEHKDISIRVGLEGLVGNDSPATGD